MKRVVFLGMAVLAVSLLSGCGGGMMTSKLADQTLKVGFQLQAGYPPNSPKTVEYPGEGTTIINMGTNIEPIVVDGHDQPVRVEIWDVTCPDGHILSRRPGDSVPFLHAQYFGSYSFCASIKTGGDAMRGGKIRYVYGKLEIVPK